MLGAITGSIAEATFGIPHHIEKVALSKLSDTIDTVVQQFRTEFNVGARPGGRQTSDNVR